MRFSICDTPDVTRCPVGYPFTPKSTARLAAGQFEKFTCNTDSLVVGLNTDHLYRIVKTATNDDTMTIQIDKNDSNHLKIILENGEKKQVTKYSLSLLDRDEPNVEMPAAEFSARITMPSMEIGRAHV